jgi:GntR family transcriptional regulator, carbon starvation induced regulator
MARARQGRSLVEDVYEALRSDILFGRRLPSSRLHLNELAELHDVSLSVVREAVTRLASEDLVEANPQRGFRVRSISLEHLRDLTWVRIEIETLALRQSIAKGDVTWEANLVAAHHRLSVTPMYFEDGRGNTEWMAAHGAFHAALAAGAGSPVLERVRRQLYDASELYRYWSGSLPNRAPRAHVPDEHKAIFDAALAREADLAADLLTQHLDATVHHLEAIASDADTSDPEAPATT